MTGAADTAPPFPAAHPEGHQAPTAFSLSASGGAALAEGPNRLLTILTAPEPQTQLMAMVLVLAMNALAARADAPVLLDGVTAAAADAMGAAIVAPGTTVTSF